MPIRVFPAPAVLAACGLLSSAAVRADDAVHHADAGHEWVHGCWAVDDSGLLSGTRVRMPMDAGVAAQLARGLRDPGDNRLDIVVVGDGYTAGQLALFDLDADGVMGSFFRYEPFKAYEPYFRVTKIDVVSAESGVDNDPSPGVSRNTAMDMGYWCANIERLLCINVNKAYGFANQAPFGVDQVLAIANSSKYGGAGYPSSNLGTVAGSNASAVDVAIHEMGHSLGDLADEYDYGDGVTYTGVEPADANASVLTAAQMLGQQRKWWRWIGVSDTRFDNPVNTYEGAIYSQFGAYRPSPNSMMRSLNRRFNGPSAEALIAAIYLAVSPIDGVSPVSPVVSIAPDAAEEFAVIPMQPIGHALDIFWSVDGVPLPALDGQESVDALTLGLAAFSGGPAVQVQATVVDPTTMVRDEAIREALLTDSFTWTVTVGLTDLCATLDLTGDGTVTFADVQRFISWFGSQSPGADIDGNGLVNFADAQLFTSLFSSSGCP